MAARCSLHAARAAACDAISVRDDLHGRGAAGAGCGGAPGVRASSADRHYRVRAASGGG